MRTKATESLYEARWLSLTKRASREVFNEILDDVSPLFMANWLSGCRYQLRRSTYRQYKAAVIWQSEKDDRLDASEREYVRTRLDSIYLYSGQLQVEPLSPSTSSHALKRIDPLDWAKLTGALAGNRSVYDKPLLAYLEAGRRAGLRPCEWAKARLLHCAISKRYVLIVRNSKNTNGRAHGTFRRLVWCKSSAAEDIAPIRQFLEFVDRRLQGVPRQDRAAVWKTFCRAMQDRLRNVARALWPKRKRQPCLYTTRNMFAATIKVENSRSETAALMGHAVDDTASKHYARALKGSKGLPPTTAPTAHPRDVARVRPIAKTDWQFKKTERANPTEEQPEHEVPRFHPRQF
jgi:hypothetical protein